MNSAPHTLLQGTCTDWATAGSAHAEQSGSSEVFRTGRLMMGTVEDSLERSELILFSLLKSSRSQQQEARGRRAGELPGTAALTEGLGTSPAEGGHPAGRDSGSGFD